MTDTDAKSINKDRASEADKPMESWEKMLTTVQLALLMAETSHTDICQQISEKCRNLHEQGKDPSQEELEEWISILQQEGKQDRL